MKVSEMALFLDAMSSILKDVFNHQITKTFYSTIKKNN